MLASAPSKYGTCREDRRSQPLTRRRKPIMSPRIACRTLSSCLVFGLGLFVICPASPAQGNAESGLLSIVSLEYQINGDKVPREWTLLPYLPYLKMNHPGIVEVAAMATLCQEVAIQHDLAVIARQRSASDLFLLPGTDIPGSRQGTATLDSVMKEFRDVMRGPLIAAAKKGRSQPMRGWTSGVRRTWALAEDQEISATTPRASFRANRTNIDWRSL